jgi:putative ABC transport system substrate-binding protein
MVKTGKYILCLAALFFFFFPLMGRAWAETVGVIITRDSESYEKMHQAFLSYLTEKGLSKRVKFITQSPNADPIAWSNAARKLIALDVDAIVVYGAEPTISVIRERSNIPVIYAGLYEATASGIRANNVTGVCAKYSIPTLLRYLKAADALGNLGVVYCGLEEESKSQMLEIKALTSKYDFRITELNVKKASNASTMLAEAKVDALFMTSSSVVGSVYNNILRIADSRRIPTASLIQSDEMFATVTMAPEAEEIGREAARKLAQILGGTPVGRIPATCSSGVEIVFNLKEAQSMGLKIPMNLVTEATRIIQ